MRPMALKGLTMMICLRIPRGLINLESRGQVLRSTWPTMILVQKGEVYRKVWRHAPRGNFMKQAKKLKYPFFFLYENPEYVQPCS